LERKTQRNIFDLSFFDLAKIREGLINECHKMSDFKRKKLEQPQVNEKKNESCINENEKMKKK